MLGKIASSIGQEGGVIGAVNIVKQSRDKTIKDKIQKGMEADMNYGTVIKVLKDMNSAFDHGEYTLAYIPGKWTYP